MAIKNSSKKVVQDIVPSEKRSIRGIPVERSFDVPARSKIRSNKFVDRLNIKKIKEEEDESGEVYEEEKEEIEEESVRESKTPKKKVVNKRGGSKALLSFVIIFICIAIIGIALSLLYSKAIVTITPKVIPVNIDGTFTAKRISTKNQDTVISASDLVYDSVSFSSEITKSITALKGSLVKTKAKGVVTIYNDYSSSSQALVAGTRLAGSNGLIYRTTTSVVIPGKKTSAGSINVSVLADKPGADYNIDLASHSSSDDTFNLLGYKGTDKYVKFYARLKTDITGGFLGNKMIIDSKAQKDITQEIKDNLKLELTNKLKSMVPKGYVMYENGYSYDYEVADPVMKDSGVADIRIKGTVYGMIFKSDDLLKFIAGKEIQKFPATTFNIDGMDKLDFKISNTKDFSIKKGNPVIFNLKGSLTIVGTFSEEKIKNDLKGISLADSNTVFANYSAISNAHTLLTPFWMRSFPKSINNIIIEYKDNQNKIQK